jgi:hypothetical protein
MFTKINLFRVEWMLQPTRLSPELRFYKKATVRR